MKLSKTLFRWLLVAYIAIIALNLMSDYWSAAAVPEVVRQAEARRQAQPRSVLFDLLLLGLLATVLAGLVGMFLLWPPARYIFLASVVIKILISPWFAAWAVHTGWNELFNEAEILVDGIILTLCLVGPARRLFVPEDTGQSAVPGVGESA